MKQRQIVRTVILCAAVLLAACALKWGWGAPSLVPFDAAAVEQIELYRYDVPAAAEKKTVSDPAQVAWVCGRLSVWAFPWPFANTGAGGAKKYAALDDTLAEEQYGVGFRNEDIAFGLEVQKALEEAGFVGLSHMNSVDWSAFSAKK